MIELAINFISLTCEKCGAQLEVNSELKKCVCNYCGNEMLIDDGVYRVEHTHKIEGGYAFGYEQEKGRLDAYKEYIGIQEKKEQDQIEKERKRREDVERIRREEMERAYKNKVYDIKISWIVAICLVLSSLYLCSLNIQYGESEVLAKVVSFFIGGLTTIFGFRNLKLADILRKKVYRVASRLGSLVSVLIGTALIMITLYINYKNIVLGIIVVLVLIYIFMSDYVKKLLKFIER